MTGYGKALANLNDKNILVEIRSLNSKQFDLSLRLPAVYKEKEIELRNFLAQELIRGKIDVIINIEGLQETTAVALDENNARQYYEQIRKLENKLNLENTRDVMSLLLKMPEVLKSEKKEPDEKEWQIIINTLWQAITHFNNFREKEGSSLEKELCTRIENILTLLNQINNFEKERIEWIKNRLQKSLQELQNPDAIDKNRFEQELIYYLEKLDISEEKQRLKTHCEYFLNTMKNENNQGRKLGFITQEIGREVNTLGSKANHAEMQKIVVLMKDELEKIKEQILNIL
jgi:uncharacterized protein (TIGR00255 family)